MYVPDFFSQGKDTATLIQAVSFFNFGVLLIGKFVRGLLEHKGKLILWWLSFESHLNVCMI